MPKETQDTLQNYQSSLQATLDQTVTQMETAMVDYVVGRLTGFLMNGGLQAQVTSQMQPHHTAFRQSLNALPDTRGQGFAPSGKQLKSAELAGGNRDA